MGFLVGCQGMAVRWLSPLEVAYLVAGYFGVAANKCSRCRTESQS